MGAAISLPLALVACALINKDALTIGMRRVSPNVLGRRIRVENNRGSIHSLEVTNPMFYDVLLGKPVKWTGQFKKRCWRRLQYFPS